LGSILLLDRALHIQRETHTSLLEVARELVIPPAARGGGGGGGGPLCYPQFIPHGRARLYALQLLGVAARAQNAQTKTRTNRGNANANNHTNAGCTGVR